MTPAKTVFLKDLWNECRSRQARLERTRPAPLPLQPPRRRPPHHQLRRRQHQFQDQMPDPFTGRPSASSPSKAAAAISVPSRNPASPSSIMDRLTQLKGIYKGEELEDEMVSYYPLSAFGHNSVAASIDTALHGFLPWDHVDHLHPDWAIAIAASANGKRKMRRVQQRIRPQHHLAPLAAARLRTRPHARTGVKKKPPMPTASSSAATASSPGAIPSANATSTPSKPSTRWAASSPPTRRKKGPIFGGIEQPALPDRADRRRRHPARPPRHLPPPTAARSPITPITKTPSPSPVPTGPKNSAASAPPAPITSSAPASAPCSSTGNRQPKASKS